MEKQKLGKSPPNSELDYYIYNLSKLLECHQQIPWGTVIKFLAKDWRHQALAPRAALRTVPSPWAAPQQQETGAPGP